MAWKPYQDQENRAYMGILTTLFPEQTKTLPRIFVWSVIFLLDLCICVFGANHFGLLLFLEENPSSLERMLRMLPLLLAIFGLFWIQGVIWGWISKLFRKWRERRNVSL